MLSDAELDVLTKDCMGKSSDVIAANIGVYWDQIVAQCRLANQFQAQLAKARSDALEEAAAICDNEMGRVGKSSDYGNGAHVCRESIIEALRKP